MNGSVCFFSVVVCLFQNYKYCSRVVFYSDFEQISVVTVVIVVFINFETF